MGGSPNDGAERSTGIETGRRFKFTLNPTSVEPNVPNGIGAVKQTGLIPAATVHKQNGFGQEMAKSFKLPRRQPTLAEPFVAAVGHQPNPANKHTPAKLRRRRLFQPARDVFYAAHPPPPATPNQLSAAYCHVHCLATSFGATEAFSASLGSRPAACSSATHLACAAARSATVGYFFWPFFTLIGSPVTG